ncbi:MAG TPA: non-ribosomal peptide synthetase [Rhodocyclaceae bacterium]
MQMRRASSSAPSSPQPAPRRVHELFERQAGRTPNATAVVCGGERISYGELDERANQVAHHLLQQGTGREELVGIAMKRSIAMMAALLGTWKAGCAYVPLDPAYPRQRLAFMLRDAGLRQVLVDGASREIVGAAAAPSSIGLTLLDAGASPVWRESAERPHVPGGAGDLAYVMYTSGSTGRPKGAMIAHAGLCNYLEWAAAAYGIEAGGSVPVHSSLSFDLTVTSLYVPLLSGAHVELLEEGDGARALVAALRARRRSLVKITPAHLELLGHELAPEELAGMVGTLVIGGEQLMAEHLTVWRRHAPATRLINEYGPTETVVGCCIHEVQPGDASSGPVPIGRPIANMRLHVLDDALRPVAEGAAGELYIGGPGVARGYLGQPDLTEQRFVPDPFAADAAARLYRTGDRVRRREGGDGVLEYLGRTDDQVKVRGYRIEPGEIEQTLGAHPGVRSCAVVVQEPPGGPELVAFAVMRGGATPPDALAAFLRERLPSHLLPARILALDAMPLTANGKVDRNALRHWSEPSAATAASPRLPRTATERLVLQAFQEIFQRQDIGIMDGFFDLGGHSLAAVRLMTLLRAATGVNLPLRNLYERPTVAGMAEAIDALVWAKEASAEPAADGGRAPRVQASF